MVAMGRLFATSVGTGGACETKGSTIGPDGQQREICVSASCMEKCGVHGMQWLIC